MASSRFDLILHPVRLRILISVESARTATLRELKRRLSDVPPDVVTSHVDLLVAGGLLAPLEQPGPDGPEVAYTLVRPEGTIPETDRRLITPADHLRYFTAFAAALIDIFSRYLKRPNVDVVTDGVQYRQEVLHLTDEEHDRLVTDIQARLDNASQYDPSNERKPRILSWIIIPDA